MPFEPVETPIPSPDSFGAEGDAATLSAAAALLVLGLRLRGDDDALEERARDALAETDALHPEDAEVLQVPQLGATGCGSIPRRHGHCCRRPARRSTRPISRVT
jgi:hypothetical protein